MGIWRTKAIVKSVAKNNCYQLKRIRNEWNINYKLNKNENSN